MSTIPQRLCEIADTTERYSDRHSRWVAENLRAIAAELEAPAADAVPVVGHLPGRHRASCAIYDPVPDDCDCGARGDAVVRQRDHIATVAALQQQIGTAKPLDDPRLQELFGCAIDGALTSGYQGVAPAPEGHWLKVWWSRGRAVAEHEQELQARINALEARQVPASASDEYAVVWPDGGRFMANTLKSAQDYMSGAVPSCAERGVEPPVIVRYVPAETVPYPPQPDTIKEQP